MRFEPTIYTVESVTSGHPDKVCDQMSDAILDECLSQDPHSRVAIEVMGSHGLVVVAGEVTTKATVNYEKIVHDIYTQLGYSNDIKVITHVAEQAPEIAKGVDTGGAGDQGIMYGYATNETPEYLPRGVVLAHSLARGLEQLRTSKALTWLEPDGKTEVTATNGNILTILVGAQHSPGIEQSQIKNDLVEKLIEPLLGDLTGVEILVNTSGSFTQGGFQADTGLTGRKIMVDTYGGLIPHGGGCFSGKDPSKVDRSAAYMCRFVAKNLVAAGYARECLVSVAYAIGRAEPLMTEAFNEKQESLNEVVQKNFDFRPRAIIERLDLLKPLYRQTATYGHFGKAGLPWEEIIAIK
ncbi:MAG: S-adenosylmethionine synthase [Parcubacteria group bacterium GW2011_GWD2_43_10]|uniref:Methionine adenosyltransferase n=4 Tax=Candidatus Vebleniibacteriota TaxID=1817921 RepID=A0A1G2Q7X1_9BACT|nr:MAG: S-adenosylmethionine synthase [Parcubacteria group bacterium GW2011_GWD1_42_9]KKS83141.1 MAG: S-adenosylmethionine synthase [Parcubacteria group bacterium GW2011_GWD2_43_10]KKT11593.1 MAG: S-adenosylmethionine synthase [Parcubacteria group bacterium GW2011_GWA1_43_27]KKT22691.1 MAG: S-adenosylmethionine synthase [Parcubacteria group bacterium GW2011_GWE1_43_8]OHA55074.1 MAG: methionine adenosyltransferase [Candidatus Veblenbacteria bacterium RIFOXYA2_FULL_43_9]OHA56229.1 MAG: methionin